MVYGPTSSRVKTILHSRGISSMLWYPNKNKQKDLQNANTRYHDLPFASENVEFYKLSF